MFPIELELVANQRFRRKQPGEVDFGLERSWRSLHFFVAAGSAPSTTCQHLSAMSWWYHKHCTKSCKSQRLGVWKNPAQKRRSSNWIVKCDLASENGHFYARSPKLIYLWLSMRQLTAPSVSMTWVQSISTVFRLNRRSDGPDRTFNLSQIDERKSFSGRSHSAHAESPCSSFINRKWHVSFPLSSFEKLGAMDMKRSPPQRAKFSAFPFSQRRRMTLITSQT